MGMTFAKHVCHPALGVAQGSSFGRRSDARSDFDDDPYTAAGERLADDEEPHDRQDRIRGGLHEPPADLGRGHLARI